MTSSELPWRCSRHLAVQTGSAHRCGSLVGPSSREQLPAGAVMLISTHECDYFDELQQKTGRTLAHINVARQEDAEFFEE